MIYSTLLAKFAFGLSMPDFAFVDGESNISIDVCNSQEINMWKRGAFNWANHIFQDSNSVGLVVGTPVGPSVVREKMSLMFPNIVDGPEIDDKEDSQVTANIFSTFQWYKTQLEECTKACYEDDNCYATWAYMKLVDIFICCDSVLGISFKKTILNSTIRS